MKLTNKYTLISLLYILTYLQSSEKLFYGDCPSFSKDMNFDCYRNFAEVEQFLIDANKAFPKLTKLSSIGKSYEGRDLWLLTITDLNFKKELDKPAIWVDGGIDSDEVISTEAALGLIHRLLTSNKKSIKNLVKENVFYILPNMIPDVSELHHNTPLRPRDSTMKPWDDDGDGKFDEDGPEDLDGDKMILQMRFKDESGNWIKDEKDSRLLRTRKPDDKGPFYKRYSEGIDNDGDGKFNEDWVGGIDPNRNYPGNWSYKQRGSGPYPSSEVELRSVLDFIYNHPNIAASQHLHSSGGVILRPPSVPEMKLPNSDLNLYIALSERGLIVTQYRLATSVYNWNWPRGSKNRSKGQLSRNSNGEIKGLDPFDGGGNYYNNEPIYDNYAAYGGSLDGMYELFGILSFANEIYQFGNDINNDGRVSPSEQLIYNDRTMNKKVFKDWKKFNHPSLGEVEIGGWKKFGHNNPLPRYLQKEIDRNVEFMLMQARALPKLEISKAAQKELDKNIYLITVNISNKGFQPTELAIRINNNRALSVKSYLELSDDIILLDEKNEKDLGHLMGNSAVEASWVVKGKKGSEFSIVSYHPKAGRVKKIIKLDK